jgi:hypothetical protein
MDMKADVEISYPKSVSKHRKIDFVILKGWNLCKHDLKVRHSGSLL